MRSTLTMEISIESIHEVDLADGAMLEVELVGVHLPFGDLDVILSLLLGTLDLVPLVTGLYGSLVRRDKRVFITLLHITVFIFFFGRLITHCPKSS